MKLSAKVRILLKKVKLLQKLTKSELSPKPLLDRQAKVAFLQETSISSPYQIITSHMQRMLDQSCHTSVFQFGGTERRSYAEFSGGPRYVTGLPGENQGQVEEGMERTDIHLCSNQFCFMLNCSYSGSDLVFCIKACFRLI